MSKESLSTKERKTIVSLDETIPIQTANVEVELTEKVKIYVQDLKTHVWAHLLPNTVAVLSLGLLVDELGFSYHWTPERKPYLKRGKVKVTCHPSNNVPLIFPGVSSPSPTSDKDAAGDRALWEEVGTEESDNSDYMENRDMKEV